MLDSHPIDWGSISKKDSQFSKFFEVLLDQSVETDEMAAYKIYGEDQPGTKYKFLKSQFLAHALNNISYLDLSKAGISEQTKAVHKAYKNLFYITTLFRLGNQSGAISLTKQTLSIAEKFELHHVLIELLELLRNDALQSGNKKEFKRYTLALEKNIHKYTVESEVKTLESEIRILFAKSLYIDEQVKTQTANARKKILKMIESGGSYLSWIYYFRLSYIYFQVIGRPNDSISACNDALAYMNKNKHLTTQTRLGEFSLYKFENYILLRDYENGSKAALECDKYIKVGSNLWFKLKENEFLLFMQTLKFSDALSLISLVMSNEQFISVLPHLRERWSLFEKYALYVNGISTNKKPGKPLSASSYNKDKMGFNVAIIILNILYLLEEQKLDLLIEQVETLSKYRFHYLSGKYTRQSFLLFKLIHIMINSEFNLINIERKSKLIEKELITSLPATTELFECIQVLPPHWVWNRMKSLLHKYSN